MVTLTHVAIESYTHHTGQKDKILLAVDDIICSVLEGNIRNEPIFPICDALASIDTCEPKPLVIATAL